MKIRKVKTASGSIAVQAGQYQGRYFKLDKHIGSSRDTHKIAGLLHLADEYIKSHSPPLSLNLNPHSEEVLLN